MKYSILIILLLLLTACEKMLFGPDKATDDPLANFVYLWNRVDREFSLFEEKQLNWDSLYNEFLPRITSTQTEEELFTHLSDLLLNLRDGHTALVSDFNLSAFQIEHLGPRNFDDGIIIDNYVPDSTYMQTGPFSHCFIKSDPSIAYIRYSSFMNEVDNYSLDYVLHRYRDTRGLIFDVRRNGGGNPGNGWEILGRFVTERSLIQYTRTRNGKNHTDFSKLEPAYVYPKGEIKYLNKPVMILTDRGSYSATSTFALAALAIDNVYTVGDTTGGGLGSPKGGQLPNGWTYSITVSQTLDLDGDNWEDGVPVMIPAELDLLDRSKDEIIERAIAAINEKNPA